MKNIFIGGNNTFRDLYSKFDQIGDFTNKTKFKNPVKEEQKKQSRPFYPIKKNLSSIISKIYLIKIYFQFFLQNNN